MKYYLNEKITAYVFSYHKIRQAYDLPIGQYEFIRHEEMPTDETVVYLAGHHPPLIVRTYYGPTPLGKALEEMAE